MKWTRVGLSALALLIAVVAVGGCGGGAQEGTAAEAEWKALEQAKQQLDEKRQEYNDLVARAEAAATEAGEGEADAAETEGEGEEAVTETAEDLMARAKQLEQEIVAESEEFGARLVAYLNADPMIEGQEPTERQLAALRMKSSEDMVLAQEWIDKGGDYKRALEILRAALQLDPGNPELEEAIATAEALRYMDEERFALAEKGMTEAEVRGLLGPPNLHNIKEYSDRGVIAWFYPTAEDGAAAAVWFESDDRTGENKVYQMKFEAVPGRAEETG